METTITPSFSTTATIVRSNTAGKQPGAVIRHIADERIALFIGQAYVDVPGEASRFKYLVAEHVEDAQQAVDQLLNVYRKIPAVIIYRFNSGYETDLASWEAYLAEHQVLRSIPFFLYTDQLSEPLRSFVKKYVFIDEIITRDCLENNLEPKVNFVSKFKRMHLFVPKPAVQQPAAPPVTYHSTRLNRIAKRVFDVLVSASLLLLLLPVFLVVALLIKLEGKGPVFYTSPRAGKNYRMFRFYKFRTMVANADKQLQDLKHLNQYDSNGQGPVFYKMSNDPRITRLGSFLRNTSLDELPQLFNVLKGDMSLVGNRPLPLYEAASLTTDAWAERFLAPAGITGLWQISKRGKKDMSVEERISLDINYAHRNSFAYDMWLMVNTPFALVQKDNV
ncbi:sugar transferase [Chitinophaga japonensis]|uniref:Lipopolysaccharide/colanic/teichoic acid biosynthesis glycosyltransferase n=1 Tax=Chitinophaga japonensis TaxID=104662 RepID=A0A562SY05_CHIJA|nr:sugar transferase [Chitinophaga japonensis]TWI86201.1 lipopolysaccharide/colanic/teichoic acid biosynthesis glycosyltransferase [Chitinophaga japonensis]